jgi:hypothetical protein
MNGPAQAPAQSREFPPGFSVSRARAADERSVDRCWAGGTGSPEPGSAGSRRRSSMFSVVVDLDVEHSKCACPDLRYWRRMFGSVDRTLERDGARGRRISWGLLLLSIGGCCALALIVLEVLSIKGVIVIPIRSECISNWPSGRPRYCFEYIEAFPSITGGGILIWDGKYREWYEDGRLSVEGPFVDGKRDGLWTYYSPDGADSVEVQFVDGKFSKETRRSTSVSR